MSQILIRNPHAITLIDTALGPVTFRLQGASTVPINIVARQLEFPAVVVVEHVGQYLRGGFKGHDREFGHIVLDQLYQKIEDARGANVSLDAAQTFANNPALEEALGRSWNTPELKAAVTQLLPKVPGLQRDISQPKHMALYCAADRFSRLERAVTPDKVGFTPSTDMIMAMPSRGSDRAKCEQLFPTDEWKSRIAQAANLYLDAWYARSEELK